MCVKTMINNFLITRDKKWISDIYFNYKKRIDVKVFIIGVKPFSKTIGFQISDFTSEIIFSIETAIVKAKNENELTDPNFINRILGILNLSLRNKIKHYSCGIYKVNNIMSYNMKTNYNQEDTFLYDECNTYQEIEKENKAAKFLAFINDAPEQVKKILIMYYGGYTPKEIMEQVRCKNVYRIINKWIDKFREYNETSYNLSINGSKHN